MNHIESITAELGQLVDMQAITEDQAADAESYASDEDYDGLIVWIREQEQLFGTGYFWDRLTTAAQRALEDQIEADQ